MKPALRRSVCGLARSGEGYLLVKRPPGGSQGEKWEFPGGKVESGEDAPVALAREWLEELGVQVRVGSKLFSGSFSNGNKDYVLEAWQVDLDGQTANLNEHTALLWATPAEMVSVDLSDSDRQVAEFLLHNR